MFHSGKQRPRHAHELVVRDFLARFQAGLYRSDLTTANLKLWQVPSDITILRLIGRDQLQVLLWVFALFKLRGRPLRFLRWHGCENGLNMFIFLLFGPEFLLFAFLTIALCFPFFSFQFGQKLICFLFAGIWLVSVNLFLGALRP